MLLVAHLAKMPLSAASALLSGGSWGWGLAKASPLLLFGDGSRDPARSGPRPAEVPGRAKHEPLSLRRGGTAEIEKTKWNSARYFPPVLPVTKLDGAGDLSQGLAGNRVLACAFEPVSWRLTARAADNAKRKVGFKVTRRDCSRRRK